MYLRDYPERQGKKIWLDQDEVELFLNQPTTKQQEIAFHLMARSGLRSHEVIEVRPTDVVNTPAGPRVYVHHGKGDKARQTIATNELVWIVETIADMRREEIDEPLVETNHTKTIRRWVSRAADRCHEQTGDPGWQWLSPHDLRATWATHLAHEFEVDTLLVCEWGGWDDLETFLEHYRGAHSTQVQRRELEKVPWVATEEVYGISKSSDAFLKTVTPTKQ